LTDGAAAVREARERRPDVVVLDIGLETLNGVEAARRILADNPSARILFLTGQSSADIAEAALGVGARGYLVKTDAGGRLHLAMETVMTGGCFVSPSLPEHVTDVPRRALPQPSHDHRVVFRTREVALVNDYVRFAESALANGDTVIAVADVDRLGQIHDRLTERGVAVDRESRAGRYRTIDSTTIIETLMSNGQPAFDDVRQSAVALIESAAAGGKHVSVFGEVAPRVWRGGHPRAAVTIEQAWDAAIGKTASSVLCGYLVEGARYAEDGYSTFRDVCALHSAVHVH
jgi:hypothetical protein